MTDPRISASDSSFQRGEPPATPAPPTGPGVLQVAYALTLEDADAFFRYDVKHNPRAGLWARSLASIPPWGWLVLVSLALTAGVLIRLMLPRMPSFDLFDGLMVAVLAWLLFRVLFGDRLRVRRALRAVQRNPRFFQPYTVTVSPEGLNWTGPSGGSTTPWHALFAIVTHGEHAFFYETDRKTTILPQRAFADRRQFEKFVDTARSYHAEACRFVRPEGPA